MLSIAAMFAEKTCFAEGKFDENRTS